MKVEPPTDDRPVDPDDESLVAYLDGELDSSERGRFEQRLLEDETLRMRLRELQGTWDLLDHLPSVIPSEKLVESTLELVVADVVKQQRRSAGWLAGLRQPLLWLAPCLLIPLAVFLAIEWSQQRDYHQRLEELALAENVDAYLEADDLNFIRQLSSDSRWNQMISAAREVGWVRPNVKSVVSCVPVEERPQRLKELGVDQRTSLALRWDRYSRLLPEVRDEVREIHQTVYAQTDSDALLETMKSYAAWKETLPVDLADQIEGRDAATGAQRQSERSDALAAAIDWTVNEVTRQSGRQLDAETASTLYRALEGIVEMRLDGTEPATTSLFDLLDEYYRQQPRDANQDSVETLVMRRTIGILVPTGRTWRYHRPPSGFEDRFVQPPPLTAEELDYLQWLLPEEQQRLLELIEGIDEASKYQYLQACAEESVVRNLPFFNSNDSPLKDRYFELPQDVRDRIDLADPERLDEQLLRQGPRRGPSSSSNGR